MSLDNNTDERFTRSRDIATELYKYPAVRVVIDQLKSVFIMVVLGFIFLAASSISSSFNMPIISLLFDLAAKVEIMVYLLYTIIRFIIFLIKSLESGF
jgi:hypothetical protein